MQSRETRLYQLYILVNTVFITVHSLSLVWSFVVLLLSLFYHFTFTVLRPWHIKNHYKILTNAFTLVHVTNAWVHFSLTVNTYVVSDRLTERSIRYSGHLQGICFASEHRHAAMLWIPVDEIPFPWPRRTRLDVTYHNARNDFTMINAYSFLVFFSFIYLLFSFSLFNFFPS